MAITNFDATLPAPQSDLASNLLKDPYLFGFLQHRERRGRPAGAGSVGADGQYASERTPWSLVTAGSSIVRA
jgi:hypothetical protein